MAIIIHTIIHTYIEVPHKDKTYIHKSGTDTRVYSGCNKREKKIIITSEGINSLGLYLDRGFANGLWT